MLLGTISNAAAVFVGGFLGVLLKRGISEKYSDIVMKGLGMCTCLIGVQGALGSSNILLAILSISIGGIVGTALNLTGRLESLGNRLQSIFKREQSSGHSIGEAFVTACLLNCVGAMAIVGSLTEGLTGDHSILFTKAMLDFVSGIVMGASLGIGVCLSGFMILLYQGSITILASFAAPFLTDAVIAEMSAVGNILLIGLSFNMLGMSKLKVMDYVPGVFIAILLAQFML